MNAIVAFAALPQEALKLDTGLRLVSINSGQVTARLGHNKIPAPSRPVFVLSGATSIAALSTALQTFFAGYIVPFTDESPGTAKLLREAVTASGPTALTAAATRTLADTLRAPQRVSTQIFTELQQTGISSPVQVSVSASPWLVDRTATIVTLAKAGASIERDMVLPAGR